MNTMPSIDDLACAVAWLESYEPAPDDATGLACTRVAAWIEEEIVRRKTDAAIVGAQLTYGRSCE